MSVYLIEGTMLEGIADAIREKTGGTESILTEDMANEIRGIETGGGSADGGATEKWLFQNQQFEVGQFYDLPAAIIGVYTVFINGVEMAVTNTEIEGDALAIIGDQFCLAFYPEMGGWFLVPDAPINSGLVSVRVVEKSKLAQIVERSVSEVTENDLLGAETIGYEAFTNCVFLKSIALPNTVREIEHYAFYYCDALPEIVIPSSVKAIGKGAFSYCYALKKVVVKAKTPPQIAGGGIDNAFYYCNALEEIIVPIGCGDAYKRATNWSVYGDYIVEEEGGGGDAEGNWLFQNEQISGYTVTGLPAPVDGVSYTCFVDGEEIGTGICENGQLRFSTEDYRVYLIYDPSAGDTDWHFHPMDSQVQSGNVSIRING